jgi:hypothetical protein
MKKRSKIDWIGGLKSLCFMASCFFICVSMSLLLFDYQNLLGTQHFGIYAWSALGFLVYFIIDFCQKTLKESKGREEK